MGLVSSQMATILDSLNFLSRYGIELNMASKSLQVYRQLLRSATQGSWGAKDNTFSY